MDASLSLPDESGEVISIDELEHRIMEWLLTGPDPVLISLREQYAGSSMARRELTGVGFFSYFIVDPSAPRVDAPNFSICDVTLNLAGSSGAGTNLSIGDGMVDFLEVYTWQGAWPENLSLISIDYNYNSNHTEAPIWDRACGQFFPSRQREL